MAGGCAIKKSRKLINTFAFVRFQDVYLIVGAEILFGFVYVVYCCLLKQKGRFSDRHIDSIPIKCAMSTATVIKRIKEAVRTKGLTLDTISKTFQEVDRDHDGNLELEGEFPKLLKALGLKFTAREEKVLSKAVDPDDQEKVNITAFLAFFAPDIPKPRLAIIDKCFKVLCPSGKEVAVDSLRERFGSGEFTVIGGRRVKTEQLLKDFSHYFDSDGDGIITKMEFTLFYGKVSEAIPNDADFKAMLEASWAF
jgi:Ca2+-binding EF-hand superfamily protein